MSYFQDPYVPVTQPILSKYKGPSNSKQFNNFVSSVYTDIVALSDQINTYNAELSVWNKILLQEQNFTKTKVAAIGSQLSDLNNALLTLGSSTHRLLYKSYASNDDVGYGGWSAYPIIPSAAKAQQDIIYGQLVPHNSAPPVSKLYIYDVLEGEVVLPTGAVTVDPTPDNHPLGEVIEETPTDYVINGDDSVYYYRVVQYTNPPPSGYEEVTITITIPRDIVNNLQANFVAIHPFPEYSLTVQSVQLMSLDGSMVELLSDPVVSAGKLRLFFNAVDLNGVKVVLRNPNPSLTITPGKYTYVFGVANIAVGNLHFADTSRVLTRFKLNNNTFRRINSVGPTLSGVTYSVWYEGTDLNLHRVALGGSMPIDTNTVWVETNFSVIGNNVPVATYVTIDYTPWNVG